MAKKGAVQGNVRKRHPDRADSTWEARWSFEEGGKRKHRTKGGFPRKKDAEAFLTDVKADLQRDEYIDASRGKRPFKDVAEEWIASRHDIKPKTFAGYRDTLDRLLIPEFGSLPVGKIDHVTVQRYIDSLTERYGPSSVRGAFAVLRQVLAAAVKSGAIRSNPADGVTLPRPTKRKMLFLSATEVETLAGALGEYGLVVRFAAYTGLRAGEMAALRVRDLNLPAGPIHVTRAVSDVGGKLIEGETKTGRSRAVGIPATLRAEVEDAVEGLDPDALVFGNGDTYFRHANFYRRHFKPTVEKLTKPDDEGNDPKLRPELAGLRFHDLRHTCAALLIQLGAHPKEIAERLGHSSITVTMDTYGHIFPSRDAALTEALDQALTAARKPEDRS